MSRDPRRLSIDEIVQEIQALRGEMDRTAVRMGELSQLLLGKVRRTPADDYTSRYLAFANAWLRLGSMVEGGVRRTANVSRLIVAIERERAEKTDTKPKPVKPSTPTPTTDLVALYGEEMVSNAEK